MLRNDTSLHLFMQVRFGKTLMMVIRRWSQLISTEAQGRGTERGLSAFHSPAYSARAGSKASLSKLSSSRRWCFLMPVATDEEGGREAHLTNVSR